MKTYRLLFLALTFMLTVLTSMAQLDNGLMLHYTFDEVSGKKVKDSSGNGIDANLINNAKVEKMGSYNVLNLGSGNGYLNMTAAAGKQLISTDTYSISVYYLVEEDASLDGAGYFLWTFATNSATTSTDGKYNAYRLNAQRFAISTGGFTNEVGMEVGSQSPKGVWKHIAYVQNGSVGSLYIDGTLLSTIDNMPKNSSNFGSIAPTCNWLGRAAFTADSYLKQTLIADFRLYSRALTSEELGLLSNERNNLKYQYEHGSKGDNSELLKLIGEVESFLAGSDVEKCLVGAIEDLKDELTVAKQYAASERVAQVVLNARVKSLTAAYNTAKSSTGFDFDINNLTDSYDTERGFRHPGGLHTNADFERIKAQLAAGNSKVTQAWNVLLASEYSQAGVATWPTETIWRSGSGDNYLNAARGAHMAYQNALRWKIAGTKANADAAVRILMAWVNGSKYVSGNTNLSLASGLYGYEFAQAAELMRDYSGWKREDFEAFKSWIKRVWYPACIDFLRRRHDTWYNSANWGTAGYDGRPGHYWSNWGLCNALAVISFGILCDDVHIYNQGLSYYKYDQVGNWKESTGDYVTNYGLTEYLGHLVPALGTDDRGPYGKLGQMQESGRDQGHATMALGLAVDICQTAWSQGDDLYSYMDNRLAAGIEGLAAYNFGGVDNGPWTNYGYADCRTAWHNAWVQTGHNGGSRGQCRAYWARIVGHYEGVKGVKMKYSEIGLNNMGIDDGGTGGSSGDYDHLGYSVLTCTYDKMATDETKPTLLTPKMTVNGESILHNELGGLTNTYNVNTNTGVVPGTVITLIPQLPLGATDTGKWQWNTGEQTKSITIVADKSYVYRATYTNEHGVESEQAFSIFVQGDSSPFGSSGYANVNGISSTDLNDIRVFYGDNVTLGLNGEGGYGSFLWDNGSTSSTRTLTAIRDREIIGMYITQGGRRQAVHFNIHVETLKPRIIVNGVATEDTLSMIVNKGDAVVISPMVASGFSNAHYEWSDGSTSQELNLGAVDESGVYTVSFTSAEMSFTQTYTILVVNEENYEIPNGDYIIVSRSDGRLLTNADESLMFGPSDVSSDGTYSDKQVWTISHTTDNNGIYKYTFTNKESGKGIGLTGRLSNSGSQFYITNATGTEYFSVRSSSNRYWSIVDGALNTIAVQTMTDFPLLITPASTDVTGISEIEAGGPEAWYDLSGRRLNHRPTTGGIYILNGRKVVI